MKDSALPVVTIVSGVAESGGLAICQAKPASGRRAAGLGQKSVIWLTKTAEKQGMKQNFFENVKKKFWFRF